MQTVNVPAPLLGALAGTRSLLGIGIGLLLSEKLAKRPRHVLGFVLVGIGIASSIPLGIQLYRRRGVPMNGHARVKPTASPDTREGVLAD